MSRPLIIALVAFSLVLALASASNCALVNQIHKERFRTHLAALETIAFKNGGNRAAGTTGYERSVDYVLDVLKQTNYSVSVQHFDFTEWKLVKDPSMTMTAPKKYTYTYNTDFKVMRGSTYKGAVEGALFEVKNGGCHLSDYDGVKHKIALIERGQCDFKEKAALAVQAGAAAAVIFNNPGGGPLTSRVGSPNIPVFSISNTLAFSFLEMKNVVLKLDLDSKSETKRTSNVFDFQVIADMPGGDPNNIMVIGSHLDSVPEGPGINDNGSGTTTNLELALAFDKCLRTAGVGGVGVNPNPTLKVRFAWWGAEELGLLGSDHYVKNLKEHKPHELKKIVLNVNLDMIASPNFVYFILDGKSAPEPIRPLSARIQTLYQNAFADLGVEHEPTDFTGRSDYGPFIENGIPAGGIAAGAEGIKSMRLRSLFGGIANTNFDPCYHNRCDTLENVAQDGLQNFAKATALVVENLATVAARPFMTAERPIYDKPLEYKKNEMAMHSR